MTLLEPLNPIPYFERHQLEVHELERASQGLNNAVWLTSRYVLRVAKGESSDHEREARLALHALRLGVRTAKPLHWTREYSLWERLPGDTARPPQPRAVWGALLDDLERWRASPPEAAPEVTTWVQDPFPWDRTPSPPGVWDGDLRLLETECAARLEVGERAQIVELFQPRVISKLHFLHADAFSANVIVNGGEYQGLIDWGNAQWHALEREFAWMEDDALEIAVQRYNLNLELLLGMRVELLLKVAEYKMATLEDIRGALEQLA